MIKKINRIIEFSLLTLLFIFPFSYASLDTKWDLLWGIILGGILLLPIVKKYMNQGKHVLLSVFSILFLFIFDFAEKVNLSQVLNIQNPLDWRIPLSTIILSIAALAFLIKVLLEKKLTQDLPEYFKYFLVTITLLVSLMVLFYPILKFRYSMGLDPNIKLLNIILKYTILLILIFSYSDNKSHLKRLNIGFIVSISSGLILNIIL